jgi:hypothetical protein
VTYKPIGTGIHSRTLRIQSNDSDEADYDFVISGLSTFVPGTVTLR